jgi:NADPH:quinone reductase-like Zn-dependent oxidoreductase
VGAETAWGALEEAGVQPEQTVLVQGGAGGVGEYVVQLAVHRGARVIATASTDNIDFVRSLGASEVIDYTTTSFDDIVHDVDAVVDAVGGDVLERSMRIVRPGGIVVSTVGQPSQQDAAKLGIRTGPRVGSGNRELLEQITLLIEEGAIKPHVDRSATPASVAATIADHRPMLVDGRPSHARLTRT